MTLFGFLNCHKPSGMTSRDVVNVVQRRLQKTKVGHAGTLDPIAEGVLVLGIGAAARLVTQVQSYPKQYVGQFRLGEHSPSQDTETEITRPTGLPIPVLNSLKEAAAGMVGQIQQTPSAYSAIHINGKRAYERIRQGEVFEMPSRDVQIDSIEVSDYDYPKLTLTIQCGSGTYIRSVGADLAKEIGSCAVMTALKRTSVGPFNLEQTIDIETLKQGDLNSLILPATMAVENLPKILVQPPDIQKIHFGQLIEGDPIRNDSSRESLSNLKATRPPNGTSPTKKPEEIAAVSAEGQLIALLRPKKGLWHPYRVFPPAKDAVVSPD